MKVNKLSTFLASAGLGIVLSNNANAIPSNNTNTQNATTVENLIKIQLSEINVQSGKIENISIDDCSKLSFFVFRQDACHPVASC